MNSCAWLQSGVFGCIGELCTEMPVCCASVVQDDVSEFQEPTTTSPNNPTSPNKDGTKNAETVSSVADSIQVLCNEQRRAAARIDKVRRSTQAPPPNLQH